MSALAAAAPDLPLTLFDDDSTASSLTKLRNGKPLIIDFWTTRCERCPACLDKLDKIAESLGDKVVFAALCLDDPDFQVRTELMPQGGLYVGIGKFWKARAQNLSRSVFFPCIFIFAKCFSFFVRSLSSFSNRIWWICLRVLRNLLDFIPEIHLHGRSFEGYSRRSRS